MDNDDPAFSMPILSPTLRQSPPKFNKLPYILMLLSTLTQAFGTFYAKFIIQHCSLYYNAITFLFIRSFVVVILSFILIKVQEESFPRPFEIPHKKWFLLRCNLSFFCLVFFIFSIYYLRCSTTQVILTITPISAVTISVIFFDEKPFSRFLLGIFICSTGAALVIINEFNGRSYWNTVQGLGYSLISLLIFAMIVVSNKKVSLNQISINTNNFYQGLTTMIYSLVYLLVTFTFKYDWWYIMICFSHGVFYVIGQWLLFKASKGGEAMNKLNRLNFFQIVYVFILCYIFLGEEIYFTDVVGCLFIISFLMYKSFHPT